MRTLLQAATVVLLAAILVVLILIYLTFHPGGVSNLFSNVTSGLTP